MITAAPPAKTDSQSTRSKLAWLASVKLTVALLVSIALIVLIGAWCPQEAQVGQEKVVEMFGADMALWLNRLGVTDIFHSPLFLLLIGLLTANMIACSVQRVFPKVRSLRQSLPPIQAAAIARLPVHRELRLACSAEKACAALAAALARSGYRVDAYGDCLVAEWGKFGRLAPTITHIGLLTLLAGVSITSWTGFSGFQPVAVGGDMNFGLSEHSKLWIGSLPHWRVRVDSSWREDYETGDPKQWYSELTVIESDGREVLQQKISVNNPLSYKGVDIYQSSWALDSVELEFNGHPRRLDLRQMGKVSAAMLPLDEETILIFSVRAQNKPLKVFGKTPKWDSPRLLAEIPPGKSVKLGTVAVTYRGARPVTGLQYKCDPGLPVTYVAFAFIIAGVMLAAVPHRQVWAQVVPGASEAAAEGEGGRGLPAGPEPAAVLSLGGRSLKARAAFEKGIDRMLSRLANVNGESA